MLSPAMIRPAHGRASCVAVLVLVQLLASAPAVMAVPAALVFAPTDDASIRAAKPDAVVGGTRLEADGQPRKDALIRFVVAGVGSRRVVSASLRLRVLDPSNSGGSFAPTASSWSEATLTWANAPAGGAPIATLGRVTAGTTVAVDVTSLVVGDGPVSLRIASTSADGVDYAAKEAGAAAAPELIVVVDDPPTSDTTPPSTPNGLRTTSVSSTAIGLAWEPSNDAVGVTAYEVLRNGQVVATVGGATTEDIDQGLAPATTYRYAVRARDAAGNASDPSAELIATTLTATSDPVLVGAGDIASCVSPGDEATAAILDGVDGLVFTAGDNAYETGTATEFAECYASTWGRHRARTIPAAGNHDYMTPGASAYFAYFGASAGDPSTGYYSVDHGTWHIVVLNSNCSEVGGCGVGSAQEQWLRADLAGTTRSNIAAIWHHARYSSGQRGSDPRTAALWAALYEYGAELVIVGHDHDYERFAPLDPYGNVDTDQGVRQFVVGTGGTGLTPIGAPIAGSEVAGSAFGVLRLTLRPASYDWSFMPAAGSTFSDSGSSPVHGRPSTDLQPPTTPTGLTATAVGTARVDLAWTAATDEVGVAAYEIERESSLLATIPRVTSYTDLGVNSGATYTYRVRAIDVAGNRSAWSAGATVSLALPPATIVLAVSEDATVRAATPTGNHGADARLMVDADSVKDALFKLVVTGVGGRAITSATLRLWCLDPSGVGGSFAPTSTAWGEATVTWSTAPAATGPPIATIGKVTTGSWVAVDLTGFVTGDGTYALRASSTSLDGADYAASESTGGVAPVLTLVVGG
jgi:chitodextrinase